LLEENDIIFLIKEKIGLKNFLLLLMDSIETGFKKFAEKRITVPPRYGFFFPLSSIASTTADDGDYFACKVVNTHLENVTRFNLPTVMAAGLLVDVQTGYTSMLTEATILAALRSGVTSAIATKYLANKKVSIVGIIGNGAQALPQLLAISIVKNIDKEHAYDIDKDASTSFRMSAERLLKGTAAIGISDGKTTSTESDILITITSNGTNASPVVYDCWVRNGINIKAVGGCVDP
jgi:ornithine cyclodeaminase/alanine dehydrogenase-like protein (mu-crystallin family)